MKTIKTLLYTTLFSGCTQEPKEIIPIERVDFNGDGVEDVLGYVPFVSGLDGCVGEDRDTYNLSVVDGKDLTVKEGRFYASEENIFQSVSF